MMRILFLNKIHLLSLLWIKSADLVSLADTGILTLSNQKFILMKKLFSLLLLCMITVAAFAQKPTASDMAFTFGLNGLSQIGVSSDFGGMGTLLFRYYLSDNMALRARLDLLISSDKFDQTDTSQVEEHDKTSSHMVTLHLGVQKNMGTDLKRIEPYIAPELVFALGKLNITDNTSITDENNSTQIKTEPGGTMSIGLVLNVGFNYWFTDHLALGAEFGYGLQVSHTGDATVTT